MFVQVSLLMVFAFINVGLAVYISPQAVFDSLDTNHDGKISLEEVVAKIGHRRDVEKEFSKLDTNHDGYITIDELDPEDVKKYLTPQQIFDSFDTNHDGKLSFAEVVAKLGDTEEVRKQFPEMDKNHDGFLTVDEIDSGSSGK